ncbi:hypothetical protein JAAARDRAFT_30947 [Jaapia argillacea MUCL 33604]|uniref:Nitrogen regulatory protein areA GATA-like domain-containing protein n=1 Tax=Jaapia argillacea MUCL 33604 TaxID=933084 RepID=A0A067Q367_9AGAM|nr:hypothetical protein JAAARDRAFT_30947 [Jaapia argillacea MUCL 33604]
MANYLPLLLVSVTTNAFPDDSSFSTVPQGQVDYLSHEWREEDVWRSWRSMTRQKNAIVNGMRLENASWRTWWKQRNGLKTISPETLNWLKDSDVTWLYGPLHTGVDWSPPPTSPTERPTHVPCDGQFRIRRDSTGSMSTIQRQESNASINTKKPILKHRSIGELLTLPPSPLFGNEPEEERGRGLPDVLDDSHEVFTRPPLQHTKSDTHIVRLKRAHLEFRKDSPPRIIAADEASSSTGPRDTSPRDTSSEGGSYGSDQDLHVPIQGKKKHISFNTFVEQCIAIEKPKLKRSSTAGSGKYLKKANNIDEGYEDDSELEDIQYEDYYNEPAWIPRGRNSSESDEEEDDDVIEMRSSRSRSSSIASHHSMHLGRPPLVRLDSVDKERVTIAPIAPTILKTTDEFDDYEEYEHDPSTRYLSPTPVELVYVPPIGSNYCNSLPGSKPSSRRGSAEDVYHHREAFLSPGSQSSSSNSSTSSSPIPIPSVGIVPSATQTQNLDHLFASSGVPLVGSPQAREAELGDGAEEDAYDYFGGPDLGEDFAVRKTHSGRRKRSVEDTGGSGIVRYSQGGAASVPTGRSSGDCMDVDANEIIEERREEVLDVSDQSRPQTIPPVIVSLPISLPPTNPLPTQAFSPPPSVILSPPEPAPTRGRTTTPVTSPPVESRSESRGRSATRNSFSDRGRSSSRSSRGTESPMGSISPCGSSATVATSYTAYASGREARGRDGKRVGSSRSHSRGGGEETERGRDRVGSRLSESLSPPSVARSSATPDRFDSSGKEPSNSHGDTPRGRTITSYSHSAPSPIPEEEEQQRSRNPTPANSPVINMKPALPIPPPHTASPVNVTITSPPSERVALPSKSIPISPSSPILERRRSPTEGHDQHGLVGRAVSSARELLGAIWHSGNAPS